MLALLQHTSNGIAVFVTPEGTILTSWECEGSVLRVIQGFSHRRPLSGAQAVPPTENGHKSKDNVSQRGSKTSLRSCLGPLRPHRSLG